MSLQVMQLDDLTWNEMVDSIRGRIAANSNGEWTMHGPLDPGVTLLELFAALFEQRLYWMDQVPEPLVRSILSLLDDAPRTTACAATLLEFRPLKNSPPQQVPAGTVFYPRDQLLPLPMTTLAPVTVAPVIYNSRKQPRIDLTVNGRDWGPDLRAGRPVPLMPADGSAAGCQFILWLERPQQHNEIDRSLTLFFELDTPAAIIPEWAGLPDTMQWFDRVTPLGYPLPRIHTNDWVDGSCGLPKVYQGTGVRSTPANDPEIWINDFISSDWSYRHLQVMPPAKLKWQYSTGSDERKAFDGTNLVDGTGGLRRCGLVRIKIPDDWQPVAVTEDGAVGYALWVSCDHCTYSSPPLLKRLIPNVAESWQVESVHPQWADLASQVTDWLRLPEQQLRLPSDKPEPIENSVKLEFREGDGKWYRWRPTDHFYHHGPEDRVFVVDRIRKRLLFGNGITGRIPVPDVGTHPCVRLCYLAGGGSNGNVGNLVWVSDTTDLQPVNPVPGTGGADTETLAEAKARVDRDLSRRERAVTAGDFEELTKSTPGIAIARAHAAVGHHPGFPCHPVPGAITLFLVPEVPRENAYAQPGEMIPAPVTDPGALAEVRRRINTRRLVTTEVYVCPVTYRAVRLKVGLQGVFVGQESMLETIRLALSRYLDPLIGGDYGTGWPFGGALRPSSLIKKIREHVTTGIVVQRVAIALDSGGDFKDCADVTIGEHELVWLKDIEFQIDAMPAMQGGLR